MIRRFQTEKRPRPSLRQERQERQAARLLSICILFALLGLMALSAYLSSRADAAVANIYWRTDLHQGTGIIAYGQGSTEQAAWDDCFRLQVITRAMTAAETRRAAVGAVSTSVVRWCQNPKRYATISKDPPATTGAATLSWQHEQPPAIAGFRIVHGNDPNTLVSTVQIANPGARAYTVDNLALNSNHCFAVKAYDATDGESPLSAVACKVIL